MLEYFLISNSVLTVVCTVKLSMAPFVHKAERNSRSLWSTYENKTRHTVFLLFGDNLDMSDL